MALGSGKVPYPPFHLGEGGWGFTNHVRPGMGGAKPQKQPKLGSYHVLNSIMDLDRMGKFLWTSHI